MPVYVRANEEKERKERTLIQGATAHTAHADTSISSLLMCAVSRMT